jgi:uroporphyrinogen-III synthase
MSALTGIGVLVTRPESQAGPLSRQLIELGATVFRLPTLEIRPRLDIKAQCSALGPLAAFDWIVYVSANAVRYGVGMWDARSTPRLAAVGPATAAALTRAGYPLAVVPTEGYDSEHLLATPELTALHGRRVLIVRGGQGRDALAETLSARGADVRTLDVYERVIATPPPGAIAAVERAWTQGEIHVVTVTSVEIARALYELLSPTGRALYARTPLLLGSARIAEAAHHMALRGTPIIAARPDDAGLLSALLTAVATGQPKASA